MAKTPQAKLTAILRDTLGKTCPPELLKELEPDLVAQLQAGASVPTIAELIVKKIVRLALDPKKSNQWAVEMIYDRVEGRAAQGQPPREDGRKIEERLDAISTQHLNSLAARFSIGTPEHENGGGPAPDRADGSPEDVVDVSDDGAGGSQGDPGEPELAPGSALSGLRGRRPAGRPDNGVT